MRRRVRRRYGASQVAAAGCCHESLHTVWTTSGYAAGGRTPGRLRCLRPRRGYVRGPRELWLNYLKGSAKDGLKIPVERTEVGIANRTIIAGLLLLVCIGV